jgi:hypothetical protein
MTMTSPSREGIVLPKILIPAVLAFGCRNAWAGKNGADPNSPFSAMGDGRPAGD